VTDKPFAPIETARVEWQGFTPFARDFGDTYFSREQGVAESMAIFVNGNRLPERFSGLHPGQVFTIGEIGFGTGLNMLLAAEQFARLAPAGARLQLVSAELHPLERTDLEQALGQVMNLPGGPVGPARALLAGYPLPAPGFHRIDLAPGVDLTLMLADACQAWRLFAGKVDAWFLDGFAPDRNPKAWSAELYREMVLHSRPGATLATFTAAGHVRRGLADAGFSVNKVPGFGRKRERLEGFLGPGPWHPQKFRTGKAIVAGAGLAGATTARALAERGWQVDVLDPAGIAGQASGNPAGVIYSTPSPHLTPQNRFYQSSFLHARRWLERFRFPGNPGQGRLNGVIQHLVDPRNRKRVQAAIQTRAWPAGMLDPVDRDTVCMPSGGYIKVGAWCRALLDHPAISLSRQEVDGFSPGNPPRVHLSGAANMEADGIVLCTAAATERFPGLEWLALKRIRGQVTFCHSTPESRRWQQARCHRGYLTPAMDGLHCVGATFDLHDTGLEPRDEDNRSNLATLREHLPGAWKEMGGDSIRIAGQRTGIRCQSRDFLPLAGTLPDSADESAGSLEGMFLNIAHGSRGIASTPLCADLVADAISGFALPTDRQISQALEPRRFILRQRKSAR